MTTCDRPRRPGLAPTRYADREQRRLLLSFVRLPPPERLLLELHVWEQLTVHELALVLGVELDIVCKRLRDAIAMWRATIAEGRTRIDAAPVAEGEALTVAWVQ
jgi:DNA-directed RNA polymerase specialized sigma24 family protein